MTAEAPTSEDLKRRLAETEEKLRHSEEKFASAFQSSPDAFILTTMDDGRIVEVNASFSRLTGYEAEEALGRTTAELRLWGDTESRDAYIARILREGCVSNVEATLRTKSGTMLTALISGATIATREGRLFLSIVRDISERKRAEAALLQSERTFRSYVESSPVGIFVADSHGDLVEVNQAACSMTGYDREELLGASILRFYTPEHQQAALNHFRSLFQKRKIVVELPYIRKGGAQGYWKIDAILLSDDRVMGFATDITEHKEAEEALRTSNELLSLFIKHSPIYAFMKEVSPSESRVLKASENYVDMIGIPGSQMDGKTMQELFPAEFAAKITADDWLVVSRGEILRLDEDLNGRSYTTIKFPIVVGGRSLLAGYTIDVTERKRVEEERRRGEGLLQKIFEILPIGLWFADKDGRLLRGNPMGVKIWGAEPHASIAEYGVFKAWRLPSREPVQADDWALAKTIRHGVTIVDELLEIESFDGKRKTILNYTAPVLDEGGNVDGAIVVNLDISDRMALEDQLRQAQKMESVGRLAGGVAHDFNNMLSVILGHTEMAMVGLDPSDPLYGNLQEIGSAARRSADITRQLLAFARKQTISPKVLDLNETVEGMLKMLRRLIGEDIELVWLPGRHLKAVKMDPSQIDQILANLCVNGRDAIAGVGRLTIETGTVVLDDAYCAEHPGFVPGDFVTLAVSDNGCGMDPQTLNNLFEPFFTTKGVGKGTGLGLATVYGIVKQNEGFINVDSEPGRGTTFRLYLPAHESTRVRSTAEQTSDLPCARGGETILVVEDEPAILDLTTMMLARLGYTVLKASRPTDAIDIARRYDRKIHLLVTDVVMPAMNGRDLAQHILTLHPDIKRLFMSGYTADAIAHHGVLEEGTQFLQKPFSIRALALKVRQALDG